MYNQEVTASRRGGLRPQTHSTLLLLTVLFACRDETPIIAAWPEGIDVAVVVYGDDSRAELVGTVASVGGTPSGGGGSLRVPGDALGQLRVIGWSWDQLLAQIPELDPEGSSTVAAVEDAAACERGSVASPERRRFPVLGLKPQIHAFDKETLGFRPSTVPAHAVERLALDVPVQPGFCEDQLPTRWARMDETALPEGVVIGGEPHTGREGEHFGFGAVARVDPQRVVVLTWSRLLLLTRDQVFSDARDESLAEDSLPRAPASLAEGGQWLFTGVTADPRTREGTLRTFFLTAMYRTFPTNSGRGGGVFEVDISEEGFVSPVRTATAYWGGDGAPGAITVDEDGGWVAVGSSGLLLSRNNDGGPVRRASLPQASWFRRVISTSHPEFKHLAGSEDGVLVMGDLRGRLELLTTARPTEVGTSIRSMLSVPGPAPRLIVSTFASGAFELGPDRTWTPFAFQSVGPFGCASVTNDCGFHTLGAGALASDREGMVYSFGDRCGDLTAIDPDLRCATSLPLSLEDSIHMDASYGIITVVGARGAVLELFRDEAR